MIKTAKLLSIQIREQVIANFCDSVVCWNHDWLVSINAKTECERKVESLDSYHRMFYVYVYT